MATAAAALQRERLAGEARAARGARLEAELSAARERVRGAVAVPGETSYARMMRVREPVQAPCALSGAAAAAAADAQRRAAGRRHPAARAAWLRPSCRYGSGQPRSRPVRPGTSRPANAQLWAASAPASPIYPHQRLVSG
jgi:hypothetical protein